MLAEIVKSKTKVFDVGFLFVSRVYYNHGLHEQTHRQPVFCYLSLGEDEKVCLFCCLLKRSETDVRAWERPPCHSDVHLLKGVKTPWLA